MEAEAQLSTAYGHVSMEEYQVLQDRLQELHRQVEEGGEETLREDYEFYGAEEGWVCASYSGSCSVCGLALRFKHEEPFVGIED